MWLLQGGMYFFDASFHLLFSAAQCVVGAETRFLWKKIVV